jgi:hypothetical protein
MGVGNQCHAMAALCLGKKFCTNCTGGWEGIRAVLMTAKNLAPVRIDPWTAQPVAPRYTDYTILAHSEIL